MTWNPVDFASGYKVIVEGVEFQVTEPVYDLSTLGHNRFYEISIRAVSDVGQCLDSLPIEYSLFNRIDSPLQANYSIHSLNDFFLDLMGNGVLIDLRYAMENADTVATNDLILWEYTGSILSLDQDYLASETINELNFILFFSTGYMEFKLTLIDVNKPYPVKGQTILQTEGADVTLRFDVMGCEFIELSGNDIESSDYTFLDGILTVSSDYLDPLFSVNPTRNVILGYLFSQGEDSVISFLVIHR